ncbi:MAG: class I SAM-dependent methyltransferase [Sedimentisphaerales bacterium]|nr:class I SAM-dependent methyltransferase [Sedimentisphaerales bacterium]
MAEKVCPFWVGYLLSNPLRKLWHNPEQILEPYVRPGMKVVDIGCAMGFFSLALAKMVGQTGKVMCVDIQKKMISSLEKRAQAAGLLDRIETHVCSKTSFYLDDLHENIDFALAFAVVHELADPSDLFSQMGKALKPQAAVLMAEPRGRVSEKDFEASIQTAQYYSFEDVDRPHIRGVRAVLLRKI